MIESGLEYVQFDTAEHRNAVVKGALDRGLFTLGCGKESIRLHPPLESSNREVKFKS
ncbi:hypothetical protein [Natrialba magadii]|uniref:hypothetical protein n=1 Tax=Natrialba magadii TaxID=13769 RepID=UPI000AD88588